MSDAPALPITRADLPDLYRFLLQYASENQRVFWEQRRLDGLFFHRDDAQSDRLDPESAARCALWRDAHGVVVAAVFSESAGEYSPHILARGRTFLPAVMAWITARQPTSIRCHDEDPRWAAPLLAAGFRPGEIASLSLICQLAQWQPRAITLPARSRIRSMTGTPADVHAMAALLNAAFARDFHTTAEYRAFQRCAPSYAQMLDLVVEDAHGHLVATAGFTMIGNRTAPIAALEPVATHPAARRIGCAGALLQTGFAAVKRQGFGTIVVNVSAANHAAQRLYASLGCIVSAHERTWLPRS